MISARPKGIALAALAFVFFRTAIAGAQACCAGGSALTPGRLALHEDALVGAQVRAANGYAEFDSRGHYATPPAGASELELEQDVFGAVRFLDRAQLALLVPLVETRRQTRTNGAEFGGGLGDINVSGRYDFTLAGTSKIVPGIGLLVGLTLPTGTPVESAGRPLATDATGVGAFQGNVGLALEQTYGPWTLNLFGILAKRALRETQGVRSMLGTQLTGLAAAGYVFTNDAALVLLGAYTIEGDATVDGQSIPGSARRMTQLGLAGLWPLSDRLRLNGSLFMNPPIPGFGLNLPATAGFTFGGVWSWS